MKAMSLWLILGVVTMTMVTGARAAGVEMAPFAKKLPQGWRELAFGLNEDAAKAAIARMRKGPRSFERSLGAFGYSIDFAAKRLVKMDFDTGVVHHLSVNDLDPDNATVHGWFQSGKLVAVDALSTRSRAELISRLTQQYGTSPRMLTVDYADETGRTTKRPTKTMEIAVWKGAGVTAIVFQPTAWGPEQLVISDAAAADFNRMHAKAMAR